MIGMGPMLVWIMSSFIGAAPVEGRCMRRCAGEMESGPGCGGCARILVSYIYHFENTLHLFFNKQTFPYLAYFKLSLILFFVNELTYFKYI